MDAVRIIGGGGAGTTAMTLFSYAVSKSTNKNFREPQLLATIIGRLVPSASKTATRFAGWILHYIVGFFFATIYSLFFKKKSVAGAAESGISIGALTGIVGIIVWNQTFKTHPNPPEVDHSRFYGQLIVAHMIFGLVTVVIIKSRSKSANACSTKHLNETASIIY